MDWGEVEMADDLAGNEPSLCFRGNDILGSSAHVEHQIRVTEFIYIYNTHKLGRLQYLTLALDKQ
jgi:hypothetical protein